MPSPPPYNPNIRIAGIEVTQTTQYFNLTGQGSGAQPDNSVPLVDNMTTVLRVYPNCLDEGDPGYDPNFDTPRYITADLEAPLPVGVNSSVLNGLNDRIFADSLARTSRGRVNDTLNFRIPAFLCTGTMT